MKERNAPSSSKTDLLYRDYRREANILDFSGGIYCRELRRQRREKLRKRFCRWLLFVGIVLVIWLLKL